MAFIQDIMLEVILRYPSDLGEITTETRDRDFAPIEALPEDRFDHFRSVVEDGFRVARVRLITPVEAGKQISVDLLLNN